eukprot:90376_1
MDGNQLVSVNRKTFANNMCKFINNKALKLKGTALKLYDSLTTFDVSIINWSNIVELEVTNNSTLREIDPIQQEMEKFESEQQEINKRINELHEQNLPLYTFSAENVADKIKWWLYNDINYKNGLRKTLKIFSKSFGEILNSFSYKHMKTIVKDHLLKFMTEKTLEIMFKYFEKRKKQKESEFRSKSPAKIAYILYNYPLDNLLRKINHDGKSFIKRFERNDKFIEQATGWKSHDIYQINAILFRHSTLKTDNIMQKIKSLYFTIESFESKEMVGLVNDVCNKTDELNTNALAFTSYFEENKIDGKNLVKMDRKEFSKNVAEHYNNNLLKSISLELYNHLMECDISKLSSKLFNIKDIKVTKIEQLDENQMICLLNNIWSKKLSVYKDKQKIFSSYFKQNNLSGDVFAKMKATFGDEIVNHCTNTRKNNYLYEDNIFASALKLYAALKPLPKWIVDKIKNVFVGVETLHYKIKHGKEIQEFSDKVINMVDELVQLNDEKLKKSSNDKDAYLGEDLIKRIYEVVSSCFVASIYHENDRYIEDDTLHQMVLLTKQEWICHNCSNHNFSRFIGGELCTDLSICSLCGIKQIDSTILKLKNHDTFVMINNAHRNCDDKKEREMDSKDDVEDLIELALESEAINLYCPNRNDTVMCPAFMRLAKNLIRYKRWVFAVYQNTKGNDQINQTTQINIPRFIDNDTYKKIFIQCAEKMNDNKLESITQNIKTINMNQLKSITTMLAYNKDGIGEVQMFLKLNRKEFTKIIREHTKILPAVGVKIYKNIKIALEKKTQSKQFGEFLTSLDIDSIDNDYYHILKVHIHTGDAITIKNAFRFFVLVVHYEDTESEKK